MKKLSLLVIICILYISCSSSSRILVKVWTNKADFPIYAEIFNKSQDDFLVQVFYVKDLHRELAAGDSLPDLVIGDYLNSESSIRYFQSLDNLFYHEKRKPQGIRTDDMYDGLLSLCKNGTATVLLPVCFNIPGFVSLKDDNQEFITDFEHMKDNNISFNKKAGHMAFSYYWHYDAIIYRLASHDVFFYENPSEIISWDNDKMISELENLSGLETAINGKFKYIHDFFDRYYNAPSYKLLSEKRILHDYLTSGDYHNIPASQRDNLEISWMGSGKLIPVCEDIPFAGIHRQAVNAKGARAFLRWMISSENEVLMMKEMQMQRLNSFGILGGLSSLREVNENEIPRIYPDLVGNIPLEENLKFPSVLPPEWPQLKSAVIIPWFRGYFSGEPGLKSLPETFRTWKNQYLEK